MTLQEAEAAYRKARAESERLRAERNRLIREALKEGSSQAEIARATGLTRGRIAQLVQGETK